MLKPHVFVVDDDTTLREAITFLLASRGVSAIGFASAEAFLAAFHPNLRGCLLTDVRMTGMSGLELYAELAAQGSKLPCLVLTGHGDVPMAVEALKMGVRDFVEKPFDGNLLVDKLLAAIASDQTRHESDAVLQTLRGRVAALTAREGEVMRLLIAGKQNKVIADDLGISIRTVEVHRSRVLEKMGVKSAVELATLLASLD
jgi:two-component system, LuxR family, response regulator DctR